MKKLTAFFAVVALGLLTTLTASAQLINVTINKVNATTTPVVNQSFVGIDDSALLNGGTKSFSVANPSGSTKSYTNLGAIGFLPTPTMAQNNFVLHVNYEAIFAPNMAVPSTTNPFSIDWNVSTTLITAQNFNSFANVTAQNVGDYWITASYAAVNPLTSFTFTYTNAITYTVNILDTKAVTGVQGVLHYDIFNEEQTPVTLGNFAAKAELTFNAVPEPSTYALMGASGLAALVGFRRFRSKKANKA